MHDHELQRRMLLRCILAAGAMSVPMVGRAKSGATGVNAVIAKTSQEQALYQDHPKADQNCANCANFLPPASCNLVEGTISANGWCALWTQK